jgi:hypothetical protein
MLLLTPFLSLLSPPPPFVSSVSQGSNLPPHRRCRLLPLFLHVCFLILPLCLSRKGLTSPSSQLLEARLPLLWWPTSIHLWCGIVVFTLLPRQTLRPTAITTTYAHTVPLRSSHNPRKLCKGSLILPGASIFSFPHSATRSKRSFPNRRMRMSSA